MKFRVFAFAIAAFSCAASAQTTSDDRAAFEKVCGACHPITLINSFRSTPDWKETVDNMIENGAKGTDAQFDAVMRYLLRNWTAVNINTASAAEIAAVLDISDSAAQGVVDYRVQHGPFRSIDDLKRAPGNIGAKVDQRKDRIAF